MIKGIGVDLVDLTRLNITHQHFLERVLTKRELELFYSKKTDQAKREFLGGRFACKEAYVKALKKGLGEVGLLNIEILQKENGEPYINDPNCHVSISHEKNFAIAFVVIEE